MIEQLNEETAKLEQLKKDLREIDGVLRKKGQSAGQAAEVTLPEKTLDRDVLRDEIRSLHKQLELQEKNYEYEQERLVGKRWAKLSEKRGKSETEKVKKIEEELAQLIEKEQKIHKEESELLNKKREMVDELSTRRPPDPFAKDLGLEKEEIKSRLNEIQKRDSTLGEELRRFRPPGAPPS